MTVISPLLSFRNLRTLDIRLNYKPGPGCAFDLDDDSFAAIASSWPHLEELVLGRNDATAWHKPYKPTLKALSALAKGCPRLHFLSIRLNLASDENLSYANDIHENIVFGCPSMATLLVGDSPIAHGDLIGPAFVRLFPELRKVYHSFLQDGKEWNAVQSAFSERHSSEVSDGADWI